MNKFARLFDLGNYQVLLTKGYDAEEESFSVSQTTENDHVSYSIKLSMNYEDSRDRYFDTYNEEDAKHYLASVTNILGK